MSQVINCSSFYLVLLAEPASIGFQCTIYCECVGVYVPDERGAIGTLYPVRYSVILEWRQMCAIPSATNAQRGFPKLGLTREKDGFPCRFSPQNSFLKSEIFNANVLQICVLNFYFDLCGLQTGLRHVCTPWLFKCNAWEALSRYSKIKYWSYAVFADFLYQ